MPASLGDVSWPLRTARLLIRAADAADAASVHRYRRLPEVAEWMTSLADDAEVFTTQFCEPERLGRTLVVERAGEVVGDLMLRIEDAWGQTEVAEVAAGAQAEIGWAFDPAVHGQGLASEAARRLLELAFQDLGLRRVYAVAFAANERSWRLMERLGMRGEGSFVADSLHRSRGCLDSVGYALLRDEWVARPPVG